MAKKTVKKAAARKAAKKAVKKPVVASPAKSRRVRFISQAELDGSSDWTEQQKLEFLKCLELTANVSAAARAIGKKAAAAIRLRDRDQKFAADFKDAIETAVDMIEQIVMDRVANGTERPLGYQGQVYAVSRRYSDQLAMFYLKAKRPDTFGRMDKDAEQENTEPVPDMLERKLKEMKQRQLEKTKETNE